MKKLSEQPAVSDAFTHVTFHDQQTQAPIQPSQMQTQQQCQNWELIDKGGQKIQGVTYKFQ